MSNRSVQLFIVIACSVLTLIATDILLPSLPQIARDFAISASTAKMLISIYMAGQFVTVLLWGIIADLLGKRTTLFIGMLIFLAGSLLSLGASTIDMLLFSRFLQGAGAVVVPVAGWALVQELFRKDEGVRIMAWIGTITAILPLFAPALGGKIDVLYGWHSNLYCIALYAIALCLLMMLLPRQNPPPAKTQTLAFKLRFTIYGEIIKNKTFLSYIALFGLLNSGEWCFLTMAPFYYAEREINADTMGLFLMLIATGFVIGSLVTTQLSKYLSIDRIMHAGILLALISSLLLLLSEYWHWSDYQLVNAIMMCSYIASSAMLWGGTTSRALQCFEHSKGSASAIRSLILLCFASLGTYAGRLINHNNLASLALFLFLTALAALLIFYGKQLKEQRIRLETSI